MMRALGFAWVVAAGCAEPVVTMQLEMPASVPADFDLSCITAVDVLGFSSAMLDEAQPDIGIHADQFGERPSCVDIAGATSLAELSNQLHGHVDVPMPAAGLAAIELRARMGNCLQLPYGEGLVYGGGLYKPGASTLAVSVATNISCKAASTVTVAPLDILARIGDATHTCKPIVSDGTDGTFPGVIRPTRLSTATSGPDRMMFENGAAFLPLGTDGTVTLPTFSAAATDACIAVGRDSMAFAGGTCVNPGARTVCAAAGVVELPVVARNRAISVYDGALIAQFGLPVLGSAWEKTATSRSPLAGAVVTVADPARAQVVYLDLVNGNLTATAGAATTASGLFFVYTNGISAITVTAAGHTPDRRIVGAGSGEDGTTLAVLAPQ